MKNKNLKNKGFVALISSVIMSSILILIVVNTSLSGFNNRFNIFDSEKKEFSGGLADACIDVALLGFAQNYSYSGNVNVAVGGNSCFIGPVTTTGAQKIFKTQAIFLNSYTNYKITVNSSNFSIISVEEVLTF